MAGLFPIDTRKYRSKEEGVVFEKPSFFARMFDPQTAREMQQANIGVATHGVELGQAAATQAQAAQEQYKQTQRNAMAQSNAEFFAMPRERQIAMGDTPYAYHQNKMQNLGNAQLLGPERQAATFLNLGGPEQAGKTAFTLGGTAASQATGGKTAEDIFSVGGGYQAIGGGNLATAKSGQGAAEYGLASQPEEQKLANIRRQYQNLVGQGQVAAQPSINVANLALGNIGANEAKYNLGRQPYLQHIQSIADDIAGRNAQFGMDTLGIKQDTDYAKMMGERALSNIVTPPTGMNLTRVTPEGALVSGINPYSIAGTMMGGPLKTTGGTLNPSQLAPFKAPEQGIRYSPSTGMGGVTLNPNERSSAMGANLGQGIGAMGPGMGYYPAVTQPSMGATIPPISASIPTSEPYGPTATVAERTAVPPSNTGDPVLDKQIMEQRERLAQFAIQKQSEEQSRNTAYEQQSIRRELQMYEQQLAEQKRIAKGGTYGSQWADIGAVGQQIEKLNSYIKILKSKLK